MITWFVPPLESDKKVSVILLLEGDREEVKKGTGIKILTPSKLLTRRQYY